MKAKRRYLPNFEARSVMIIAAWAVGSAAAAHAQTPSAPPRSGASMTAPSTDVVPPKAVAVAGASQEVTAAFTAADTNHDGKLSRTEAQAIPVLAERFNKVDTNHDGFISFAEYNKAMS